MNKERRKQILEILLKEKRVTVKDLAKRLYSSEPSVRRDLTELENQKLIKRIHGGAVLEEDCASDIKIPFIIRELEQSDAKIIMAKKAAELVNDGDVIMMDASSSAYYLIPFLSSKSKITVITSGVKTLMKLAEYGINAYSTGGRLISSCLSLTDDDAYRTISQYNADIAFFSCRGISPDGYVTDFSIEENLVRRKMIDASKKSALLCAGKKFNMGYMHKLCSVKDVDFIISETEVPENFLKTNKKNG